jgi:hypothetical protein
MKMQTPRSRWCSLAIGGSEHRRGSGVAGRRARRESERLCSDNEAGGRDGIAER